ncbi:UNVERIFIED_ORG: CBS-domain-containing membrane protein [Xanthobacter viscosus]|jgi:CBS-domain-containing membrane protein|uniref:HPP family protein n=1 Tax=Xanthobacter autotrophicus TaxID=280 RepID=A0A6C1KTX9_XANAU|nr:HPP family protein [Xanthobacter autotrophicus]TLX42453.1 HPP family protein [Xanthobacter autotrophicus]
MRQHLKDFFARHEPHCGSVLVGLKSGAGGMLGMGLVGGAAAFTQLPLLIAPFGASAVLLFGHPATPLAQPANVIGGYAVSATIGLLVAVVFPGAWWAAALGVGLAILAMLMLRLSHPPAGAVPILMVVAVIDPFELGGIVFAGSIALVLIASLYHRLPPRHDYPRRIA